MYTHKIQWTIVIPTYAIFKATLIDVNGVVVEEVVYGNPQT